MKFRIFLIILSFSLIACKDNSVENSAIIRGNIETNINGKIYLVDVASMDDIIDSAEVVKGTFNFNYKANRSTLPFQAMLKMWDGDKGVKYLRPIGFVNPFKKNSIESVFYVDKGTTEIANPRKFINRFIYEINGSRQNEPYYRKVNLDNINEKQNSSQRERVIKSDIAKINKYPYSHHLLTLLYSNREGYSIPELKLLIDAFDDEAKMSEPYNKLKLWITYNQENKPSSTSLSLENEKGSKEQVFNNTAEINMLVFWASWCGPCRLEIPDLKEIHERYSNKGLAITSISVDDNKDSWQKALKDEKMPWKQLITNDSTKTMFDLEFKISAIPVIVLIDKNRRVIKRFLGVTSKEEFHKYLSVLD